MTGLVSFPGIPEPFAATGMSFEWGAADPEPEQAGPFAAFVMGAYRHPDHDFAGQLLQRFRLKPCQIGLDLGCACHPLPFPAAQDYRRRTKHRNRRKR